MLLQNIFLFGKEKPSLQQRAEHMSEPDLESAPQPQNLASGECRT